MYVPELKQIFPQHKLEYKELFHTKLEAMLFLVKVNPCEWQC